jgi:CheY-like chemotaxis protein
MSASQQHPAGHLDLLLVARSPMDPVLLVEARSALAENLAASLRERGYDVVVAGSEAQARESLQSLVTVHRSKPLTLVVSPAALETPRFGSDIRLAFGRQARIVVLESVGPPLEADAVVQFPYTIDALVDAIRGP